MKISTLKQEMLYITISCQRKMLSMKCSTFVKKNKSRKSLDMYHTRLKILLHTVNLIQLIVKLRERLFSSVLTIL